MDTCQELVSSNFMHVLRKWRENVERKSGDVIRLWEEIAEEKLSKLGNEKLVILEQVTIASFDHYRFDIAEKCMKELLSEFPNSIRVQRLNAMRQELTESYDDVDDTLAHLMQKDDTNPSPRKRKIAILKAKGQTLEAIAETCSYLTKFMSDQEAWHQLCALYLEQADYEKALFCLDELLLHNPQSYLLHLRLADVRYTMGGVENVEIAKSCYMYTLKLSPGNVRALGGLILSCMQITNSKAVVAKRKEAQVLHDWAVAQIKRKYEKSNENKKNNCCRYLYLSLANNMDIKK